MMFSSDQRFLISGDSKESLKEALKCALLLDDKLLSRDIPNATRIGSFCIHEEHGLVFGNDYSTKESSKFQKYPMPVTLDMAVEHAIQYLSSAQAAELRRATYPCTRDGGVHEGWEIHIPKWAYFRAIVAIRPSWTYYAK